MRKIWAPPARCKVVGNFVRAMIATTLGATVTACGAKTVTPAPPERAAARIALETPDAGSHGDAGASSTATTATAYALHVPDRALGGGERLVHYGSPTALWAVFREKDGARERVTSFPSGVRVLGSTEDATYVYYLLESHGGLRQPAGLRGVYCLRKVPGNIPDYGSLHCQIVRGRGVRTEADLKTLVGGSDDDDVSDVADKKSKRLLQALARGPDASIKYFDLWQDVFATPAKAARLPKKPGPYTLCNATHCFDEGRIYALSAHGRVAENYDQRGLFAELVPLAAPASPRPSPAPKWLGAFMGDARELGSLPFADDVTVSFFVSPRDGDFSGGEVSLVYAQGESAAARFAGLWHHSADDLADTTVRAVDHAVLYYQRRPEGPPCVGVFGDAYGHGSFAAALIATNATDADGAVRLLSATKPSTAVIPKATACALVQAARAGKTSAAFTSDGRVVGYDEPGRLYCFSQLAVPTDPDARSAIDSGGIVPCGELSCGGDECNARECSTAGQCDDGPGWNHFRFEKTSAGWRIASYVVYRGT